MRAPSCGMVAVALIAFDLPLLLRIVEKRQTAGRRTSQQLLAALFGHAHPAASL